MRHRVRTRPEHGVLPVTASEIAGGDPVHAEHEQARFALTGIVRMGAETLDPTPTAGKQFAHQAPLSYRVFRLRQVDAERVPRRNVRSTRMATPIHQRGQLRTGNTNLQGKGRLCVHGISRRAVRGDQPGRKNGIVLVNVHIRRVRAMSAPVRRVRP